MFEEGDLIIQAEKLTGIDRTAEMRRRTDGANVMQGANENVEDRNEFHIEQASLGFRRRGTSQVRGYCISLEGLYLNSQSRQSNL